MCGWRSNHGKVPASEANSNIIRLPRRLADVSGTSQAQRKPKIPTKERECTHIRTNVSKVQEASESSAESQRGSNDVDRYSESL